MRRQFVTVFIALAAFATGPAFAAGPPDSKEMIVAQQRAMAPLQAFDGVWRGPATLIGPGGQRTQITQTERVGAFLGGSVKVIEGRGWGADGTSQFNALGIISFSTFTSQYAFHSYAQGYSGDFAMQVTPGTFVWTAPAGPGATIRYTATVKDNTWTEVGERIVEGQAPVRTFEMALIRVADTDWPAAGAVPAR